VKLGLGSAQFGMDYGISNASGKPGLDEVRRILEVARDVGVEVIDTAQAYGESETVLGALLWPDHPFRIVTKTRTLADAAAAQTSASQCLVEGFQRSLASLRQPSVYGLLFHRADDLAGDGARALVDVALALKDQRLVQKVGISVYTGAQIDTVLEKFVPDIIQVPLNVLDQRLVTSRHLQRMKQLRVEVHARSIFLQGVLLSEPSALPAYFTPYRRTLEQARDFARDNGLSPLQLALGFVASVAEVDVALVGVTSAHELRDISKAWNAGAGGPRDWTGLACPDEQLVDPSRWRL
jgi:aryl-alcohol dehydrogenase-like predicted oxidoreductase